MPSKQLIIIVAVLVLTACTTKPSNNDLWQGTYYPNGCLSCESDYVFSQTYDNYEDCKKWAFSKIENREDKVTCNKNCINPDESGMQTCEVVVRNWNPPFGDGVTFENYNNTSSPTQESSQQSLSENDTANYEVSNNSDLRKMYDDGIDKMQEGNSAEGIQDVTKAAEGGLPEAQIMLGFLYMVGKDLPKDPTKAISFWEDAATHNSGMGYSAMIYLGETYEGGEDVPQDYSKAMYWYRKGVDVGSPLAQQHLGYMYEVGHGTPIDLAEAARLYKQAADQGNSDAQSSLAIMYFKGEGIPVNYVLAEDYAKKAALQGDAKAQYLMGTLNVGIDGITADYVEAYAWYSLAKANGFEEAANMLDKVGNLMTADQITESQSRAIQYFNVIQQTQ